MLKDFHSKVNYSNWWLKKLQAQSMVCPLPPHSLIFEKFEKSTAVPDMTPEPRCWPRRRCHVNDEVNRKDASFHSQQAKEWISQDPTQQTNM